MKAKNNKKATTPRVITKVARRGSYAAVEAAIDATKSSSSISWEEFANRQKLPAKTRNS